MAWRFPRHVNWVFKGLTLVGLCLFLLPYLQLVDFTSRRHSTWAWTPCSGSSPFERSCIAQRAAVAQDTLIVVRTGGTEPQSRLRKQLDTILSTVPLQNVLIFSDLEEQVDSYHVHDLYAGISAEERAGYPEFALYDMQLEYQRQGEDTRELEGGWDLGKYMNLAMKRRIWKMQLATSEGLGVHKQWFVFIDTDTFVEWDNLLELLGRFDPADHIYLGSPVWTPGLQFAHGGSAYVLSYGALEALNAPDDSQDPTSPRYSQYGLNVTALCCGDEAVAMALKSKGVRMKGYWPMFNGELATHLSFGRDLWCEPVISLHHLSVEDMQSVWLWVEDWKRRTVGERPLLFQDLFSFIAPQLPRIREDWDNTHDSTRISPRDQAAHKSFTHCAAACEADTRCFQFVHDGTTCMLSHHIRLGTRRPPAEGGGDRYVSGWCLERIRDWTERMQCEEGAHWLASNP